MVPGVNTRPLTYWVSSARSADARKARSSIELKLIQTGNKFTAFGLIRGFGNLLESRLINFLTLKMTISPRYIYWPRMSPHSRLPLAEFLILAELSERVKKLGRWSYLIHVSSVTSDGSISASLLVLTTEGVVAVLVNTLVAAKSTERTNRIVVTKINDANAHS